MFGRADEVSAAMGQKDGRSSGGHLQSGSQLVLLLGFEIAGINQDGKIRTATNPVDVIDGGITAFVEAGCGGNCQVTSCRETDDTYAVGIHTEVWGAAAD